MDTRTNTNDNPTPPQRKTRPDHPASGGRDARFALLRWMQESGACGEAKGVQGCLRVGLPTARPAVVVETDAHGSNHATWTGVGRCGSPTLCPWCAAREAQERALEIARVVRGHWDGGEAWHPGMRGIVLVTLTIPHRRGQPLRELLDGLWGAWRRFTRPKQTWLAGREDATPDVLGWVVSCEVTHSASGGWHPHLHALVFTDALDKDTRRDDEGVKTLGASSGKLSKHLDKRRARFDADELDAEGAEAEGVFSDAALWVDAIRDDWRDACAAEGIEGVQPWAQDVTLVRGAEGINRYLVKIGFEVGSSASGAVGGGKEGLSERAHRTPFAIIMDAKTHDELHDTTRRDADLALWHEWAQVVKGRQLHRWSRAPRDLRARYADAPEVTLSELDPMRVPVARVELGEVPHWAYAIAHDEQAPTPFGRPTWGTLAWLKWAEVAPGLVAAWHRWLSWADDKAALSVDTERNRKARAKAVRLFLDSLDRGDGPPWDEGDEYSEGGTLAA
jgi:hypothetical protein